MMNCHSYFYGRSIWIYKRKKYGKAKPQKLGPYLLIKSIDRLFAQVYITNLNWLLR